MIEANIKARAKQRIIIFLIGEDKLRNKKLNTQLNNNYIMGMDGYPQDLPVTMKLIKDHIL